MNRRCAFLTLDEPGDFVIDDAVAIPALEEAGWVVETLPWRQQTEPWTSFDLVIVRSTWDYWDDTPAFLAVLEAIDRATQLANPLELMRWNLSKIYLRGLERAGVPVVPTIWFDGLDPAILTRARERFSGGDLVLKPQVGGNGQGVMRLPAMPEGASDRQALNRYSRTPGMVQPFRESILTDGEVSLFYFGGAFSHAIEKRPAKGEFRSQEERGAAIGSLAAPNALQAVGQEALDALPGPSLYARIDVLGSADRGYEVIELELIEPSLYFRTDADSPARFAEAVNAWCES